MLSDTASLDKKIEAQYIYLNGLTVSMQEFIKENAMEAQDEDFFETKMTEYNAQKAETEKVLHDLQDKRAARLSRKELLKGLIRTMSREGIVTDTFDGKLWLLLVEKATVGTCYRPPILSSRSERILSCRHTFCQGGGIVFYQSSSQIIAIISLSSITLLFQDILKKQLKTMLFQGISTFLLRYQ